MRERLLLYFFSASIIFSQGGEILEIKSSGWYEVKGISSLENITPDQARRKAENEACRLAIEHFSGVKISSNSSSVLASSDNMDIDQYSSIISAASNGVVLEKIKLDEKFEDLICEVTLKVKIGKQKGKSDPAFKITTELDREYYNHGDEMTIEVKSSLDCYLHILNFASDDSVYVLYPNKLFPNNFVRAGESFILPDKKHRKKGFKLRLGLLPNRSSDLEMIKILATKENIPFGTILTENALGGYSSSVSTIMNWIIDIPMDQMTESDLPYWIYK